MKSIGLLLFCEGYYHALHSNIKIIELNNLELLS